MDAELAGDGADPPVLRVVQAPDLGDGGGIENSSALLRRRDPSTDLGRRRPRSGPVFESVVHRQPPTAGQRESAPSGPAAGLDPASQARTPMWKMEPLRYWRMNPAGGALDTPVDGEHCSRARAASAVGGAWPPDADRAVPPRCRPGSRNAGHGRSDNRWRRGARSAGSGAGEEPEPRAAASQPPAPGASWTTAARLCQAPSWVCWSLGSALSGIAEMNRKPRRQPGFSLAYRNTAKHTATTRPLPLPNSHPLPPRFARDAAMGWFPT